MLVADRYRLGELLGRGGMGEVWQAQDEVLGRQVAVKLLLDADGDESAASRFRLEAQTAARLNHPQVVAVYDFGAWDGRFYLVMELVRGPSLAQELSSRGPLDPARVAAIAAQAASGLAAAHRQGVVHRDVKPGNLMLDADDTLKIGDFGIARFVDQTSANLTRVGQIVGTSTYLAPERALGRTAGPASDVYALGCVLYQLLAGRPPFWADSPTALLYLHVDAEPVPPRTHRADLPPAFETYLLRMLAKRPEARPSAQEVADWFAGASWREAPRPPVAGPASPSVPPPSSSPSRVPMPPSAAPRVPGSVTAPGFAPAPGPGPSSTSSYPVASPPSPPSRRKGGGGRMGARRPKVLLSAAAGVVAFVAAALIGASVFGAGDGGPGGGSPEAQPSESAVDRGAERPAADPGPESPRVIPAEATGESESPRASRSPKAKPKPKPKGEKSKEASRDAEKSKEGDKRDGDKKDDRKGGGKGEKDDRGDRDDD
ncbi:serine/threonine-protein kinase [Streptomyces albireticuli]|uniref:non-specific serine/threonine protein kinase n=1 Tax=Streptomyces albireticuli TaxID=1940 RepID=A0A2A2CWA0_9ACTN|nr:serine/threonine-protein kinase [Streptomyces albireticuli]MCD9143119.1 serine/threonine protein kinase [Streptomyces albireticuli]MCD9165362.1 serine/threonine protein kinase [Streptomyces albireticuli]MCD9192120.1 serine/threonine protein kinase [Streptomyces albireticuli]PAU44473.1 serine/threonine protein kinase [Streptomyces albireticuli]